MEHNVYNARNLAVSCVRILHVLNVQWELIWRQLQDYVNYASLVATYVFL